MFQCDFTVRTIFCISASTCGISLQESYWYCYCYSLLRVVWIVLYSLGHTPLTEPPVQNGLHVTRLLTRLHALTSGPAQAHSPSNGLRDVEKDVYSRHAAFPFFITDLATKFYWKYIWNWRYLAFSFLITEKYKLELKFLKA